MPRSHPGRKYPRIPSPPPELNAVVYDVPICDEQTVFESGECAPVGYPLSGFILYIQPDNRFGGCLNRHSVLRKASHSRFNPVLAIKRGILHIGPESVCLSDVDHEEEVKQHAYEQNDKKPIQDLDSVLIYSLFHFGLCGLAGACRPPCCRLKRMPAVWTVTRAGRYFRTAGWAVVHVNTPYYYEENSENISTLNLRL